MGRPRTFDEQKVLNGSATQFLQTGYEGTSIDDLVTVTGILRGSLYAAFGSKRGIFLAVLRNKLVTGLHNEETLDIALVALLELAPRDTETRLVLEQALSKGGPCASPNALGDRLLRRAGFTHPLVTTGLAPESEENHE